MGYYLRTWHSREYLVRNDTIKSNQVDVYGSPGQEEDKADHHQDKIGSSSSR